MQKEYQAGLIKTGLVVFIAIMASWLLIKGYAGNAAAQKTGILQSFANLTTPAAPKTAEENWKDLGAGAFVNLNDVKNKGDITTAAIRNQDGPQSIDVNCSKGTFWSENIKAWHRPQNPQSISARVIKEVCHS